MNLKKGSDELLFQVASTIKKLIKPEDLYIDFQCTLIDKFPFLLNHYEESNITRLGFRLEDDEDYLPFARILINVTRLLELELYWSMEFYDVEKIYYVKVHLQELRHLRFFSVTFNWFLATSVDADTLQQSSTIDWPPTLQKMAIEFVEMSPTVLEAGFLGFFTETIKHIDTVCFRLKGNQQLHRPFFGDSVRKLHVEFLCDPRGRKPFYVSLYAKISANLEELSVKGIPKINPESFDEICRCSPKLIKLSLNCIKYELTDGQICQAIEYTPNLTHLIFDDIRKRPYYPEVVKLFAHRAVNNPTIRYVFYTHLFSGRTLNLKEGLEDLKKYLHIRNLSIH